jgi:hypothetical protein
VGAIGRNALEGPKTIPHAVRVLSEFCPSQFGQFSELELELELESESEYLPSIDGLNKAMVGKSIIADRASMVHNHGSQGTWLEFDRVISADRASSSNPHGRGPGWSSLE